MFSKSANTLDLPQKKKTKAKTKTKKKKKYTQSVCFLTANSNDPITYSPPLNVIKPMETIRLRETISEALFFCPLYSPL